MKIGDVVLDNNVFLAPMAGITDLAFRIICKEHGCGLVYTEMISAKGLYYNDEKSFKLADSDSRERPLAIQIFGSDVDIMSEITEKINDLDVKIIDINMGCPAPKITKNGEGSALMRNPNLIGKIVSAVSRIAKKPVTVKIRKGWDDSNINAIEIAKIAEYNGAQAITVHGRTREQYYSGIADWKIIKDVKKAVNIPIIGNGDIYSAQDAKNMLDITECDGIMIGRGAQGNPWIFEEVITYLSKGIVIEKPTTLQKNDILKRHYQLMIDYKGEMKTVKEMRKHISWYIKGLKNSSYLKEKIFRLNEISEIFEVLEEFFNETQSG